MSAILPRSRTPSGAAYVVAGRGSPLVLLHGVGMRSEAWAPQIDRFSGSHEVIAIDLPGHGDSDPLPEGSDLPAYVAWLKQALNDIGHVPVNLAGHSMGALIAGGLAAEAPELLMRVALLNGVHCRDEAARAAVMGRASEIASGAFDRTAPLARWFGPGHEHEAAYALCRDLLAVVDQRGYANAYRAFASGDRTYAEAWSRCQMPALFLTGDGDFNSTPAMAEAMARSAPQGRAVVIAGHRHMVNLTAPDAVNAALSEWLAEGLEDAA